MSRLPVKAHVDPSQAGIVQEIVNQMGSPGHCQNHNVSVELEVDYPATVGASAPDFRLVGCCRNAVNRAATYYHLDIDRWLTKLIKVNRAEVDAMPRMFQEPPIDRTVLRMMASSPLTQAVVASTDNEVEMDGHIYGIHRWVKHPGSTDDYYEVELLLRRSITEK